MRRIISYGPALLVLVTAMVVLFAGPAVVRNLAYERARADIVQARLNLKDNDILQQLNRAYRDVASIVEPSVVHISAQHATRDRMGRPTLAISTGSGWIWDEQGHIVTNAHVVQNAQRIEVQLYTGELRQAEILGSDQFTDIAVLKVSPGRLVAAQRSDIGDDVQQGDTVFAFGSPFDFRFSMSTGVVSGKGRSVGVIRDDMGRAVGYENFIQVDAAINPGNSGGPLTDINGAVIGMNTAIATGPDASEEEGRFAGIGLAIPMDMIQPVVTQLIRSGKVDKGYMGVTLAEINPRGAQQLGYIGRGVVVESVSPGGPAETAGLRNNDVITRVNGQGVESVPQMRSMISSMLPGDTAKLSVWRYDPRASSSSTLEIEVPLARLDTLRSIGVLPPDQPRDRIPELGIMRMSTNSPERARRHGVEFVHGVCVEEWAEGSEISRLLENGVTIVAVRDEPVTDVDEFIAALSNLDLKRGAPVRVVRKDGTQIQVNLRVR